MKTLKYTTALGFLLLASVSFAQKADWEPIKSPDPKVNKEIMQSYTSMAPLAKQAFSVPTLVEVDFDANLITGWNFGVYDETLKQFVPSVFINKTQVGPKISQVLDVTNNIYLYDLSDGNIATYYDFTFNNLKNDNLVDLYIVFDKNITTDTFYLDLPDNVTLPDSIGIQAQVGSGNVTVVAKKTLTGKSVLFPKTTSNAFRVLLYYSQPLRVSEVRFNNISNTVSKKSVKFLYQPNSVYTIYANQAKNVASYTDGGANSFAFNASVRNLGMLSLISNPLFLPSDTDADGLPDTSDNCPTISNLDQKDIDGNGVGDVCDDYDHDSIINSVDNCPNIPSYNQKDTDGDGIGDMCDESESRLTEKYPAVVWGAIGFATLVLFVLLYVAFMKMKQNNAGVPAQNSNPIDPNKLN